MGIDMDDMVKKIARTPSLSLTSYGAVGHMTFMIGRALLAYS